MIVLHKGLANTRLGQNILPIGLQEEATRVFEHAGPKDEYTRK